MFFRKGSGTTATKDETADGASPGMARGPSRPKRRRSRWPAAALMMTAGVLLILLASALVGSNGTHVARAQTPPVFVGNAPGLGEPGLLVTGQDATVPELLAALRGGGCEPAVLARLSSGSWAVHIVGAPAVVNAAFPETLVALTPFFVRCSINGPPVAWWPGEGNADDIVGGNHGTLNNGATFAPGVIGQAFSFDGVDDYVVLERPVSLSGGFTYSAWVNFASTSLFDDTQNFFNNSQFFIRKSNEFESNHFGAFVRTADRKGGRAESVTFVKPETWYHVAATWDGTWLRIYVDAVLEDSTVREGPLVSTIVEAKFGQGEAGSVSGNEFHGRLDEIMMYNRALSGEEIMALYDAGSAGP